MGYCGMFFRKDSIVAIKIVLNVSSLTIATRLSITLSLAVNSLIGLAKLIVEVKTPFFNSLLVIGIASGSL